MNRALPNGGITALHQSGSTARAVYSFLLCPGNKGLPIMFQKWVVGSRPTTASGQSLTAYPRRTSTSTTLLRCNSRACPSGNHDMWPRDGRGLYLRGLAVIYVADEYYHDSTDSTRTESDNPRKGSRRPLNSEYCLLHTSSPAPDQRLSDGRPRAARHFHEQGACLPNSALCPRRVVHAPRSLCSSCASRSPTPGSM